MENLDKALVFDKMTNVGTLPIEFSTPPLPNSDELLNGVGGGGVMSIIGVVIVVIAPPLNVGAPPAVLTIHENVNMMLISLL